MNLYPNILSLNRLIKLIFSQVVKKFEMDPQKEYIQSITLVNNFGIVNAHEWQVKIRKCVIKTNRFNYVFSCPESLYRIDWYLLDDYLDCENFSEKDYVGAQLFSVSDNVEEMKLELDRFCPWALHEFDDPPKVCKWPTKYFRFATSKGNFYLELFFVDLFNPYHTASV